MNFDAQKIGEFMGYLQLVPTAIPIVQGLISAVEELIDSGASSDEINAKIAELVAEAEANHAALSKPE